MIKALKNEIKKFVDLHPQIKEKKKITSMMKIIPKKTQKGIKNRPINEVLI